MVRIARIVTEISKAQHGMFGATLVKLVFDGSDHIVQAYAKKLGILDFLVELLTALIGIELGLPIPEPVIAVTASGDDVLFASLAVNYPDMLHRLDIKDEHIDMTQRSMEALKKLSEWPLIHDAIAFDEWIANGDRNPGNILFDGKDRYLLIDHNLAMRLPFAPDMPVNNKLLAIKMLFSEDELSRQRLKSKLEACINLIDPLLPGTVSEEIRIDLNAQLVANMVEFLEQRLCHLVGITHQKIKTKQQSL